MGQGGSTCLRSEMAPVTHQDYSAAYQKRRARFTLLDSTGKGASPHLDAVDDGIIPRWIVLLVRIYCADLGSGHELINDAQVGLLSLLHLLRVHAKRIAVHINRVLLLMNALGLIARNNPLIPGTVGLNTQCMQPEMTFRGYDATIYNEARTHELSREELVQAYWYTQNTRPL